MTISFFRLNSIHHICKYFKIRNKRMIRILSSWVLLLTMVGVTAQSISISPYSSFGYGDKKLNYGASVFGMADVSTAYMSPFGSESNFMNPAANQNLRFTNFVFEGSMDMTNFKSETDDFSRSTTYLSRISLGFPLGKKWRGGFGFQPYSALGYNTGSYDYESDPVTANKFQGEGGLNTLQFITSYNFNENLAFGLRANYLFGELNKTETFTANGNQLTTSYENRSDIGGFTFTGGLSYNKEVSEDKFLTVGATYGLGSNINAKQEYTAKTFQINPTNFQEFNISTVQYAKSDRKVRIPQNASLGVSYGEENKWNVGAQVDWEKSSAFVLANENQEMNNRFRTAVGGYYIPQFNSYRSYFARATYRAGAFYEKTPYEVQGESISDYGITFGVGLPVGKVTDASELNIGVQFGQRGTTNSGLIKENYAKVKLSFTMNDSWFQRRKYD